MLRIHLTVRHPFAEMSIVGLRVVVCASVGGDVDVAVGARVDVGVAQLI